MATEPEKIAFTPIGFFQSEQKKPYEAGRQPDALHSPGIIQLQAGNNFERALNGLADFSHLWILFQFHHNPNWKPMISPPRGSQRKVGVFASRSPHRPNNIGMSVVRLEKIEGLKIFVSEADLLDGSPILDIKPYLAYADSHPEATMGWIAEEEKHSIVFLPLALEQLSWLKEQGLSQLESFIQHQLEYEPTNTKKKRVKARTSPTAPFSFTLAYRTWRVDFVLDDRQITVQKIDSGYSAQDLNLVAENYTDTYADKELHRQFLARYS